MMLFEKNFLVSELKFFNRSISTGNFFFYFIIFLILGFGITFRTWGVFPEALDLWADEAWWATKLAEKSLFDLGFRPIGYMWLCKHLSVLGNPDLMLRLPSLVCSIGFLICIFLCARILFKNHLVIILCVFLAAFHPKLIVFAKEFKPYSLEVFIHGVIILLALRYYKRNFSTIEFFGIAIFLSLFCYNLIFLFPAVLLWTTHKKSLHLIRVGYYKFTNLLICQKIPAVILISFMLVIVTHAIFSFLIEEFEPSRFFWGNKYGVFPIKENFFAAIGWYVKNTLEIFAWPGALRSNVGSVTLATTIFFCISSIAGIVFFIKEKQYLTLFLLSSAVLFSGVANMLGSWPYGIFRTNLFFIPGVLLILCYGIDRMMRYKYFRWPIYSLVIAVILMFLPMNLTYHKFKRSSEWAPSPQLTEVLDDVLIRYENDKKYRLNIIITDWHSWRPIFYYFNINPAGQKAYAALKDNVELIKGPLNGQKEMENIILSTYKKSKKENADTRLWIIMTKLEQFQKIRFTEFVRSYASFEKEFATHDKNYHPLLLELSF